MKSTLKYPVILLLLCFATALLLRVLLLNLGFPNGSRLEDLAHQVQGREIPIEEAVAAFCESLVQDGTR